MKPYCLPIKKLFNEGWKKEKSNGHYLFMKKDGETIKVALTTGSIVKRNV